MPKIVSQLDPEGVFVGTTEADESPLEPGVWLIPGGCVDATPPVFDPQTQIARWDGSQFNLENLPPPPSPPPPPTLEQIRSGALVRIDADVDAITATVIGNRGVEYVEAEAQALAYQQAGYTGTVPSMVQAWVNAKAIEGVTWTAQQAADDILLTAAQWRGAVDAIRTQRLNAKAYVRVAADQQALDLALAQWAGFVAFIRQQLGI